MNPRAKKVEYESPYKIIVTFTNGEVKIFDLKYYLNFPIYQSLQDESFCKKVKVENGIVLWNEEIDLDPDRLYLESKKDVSLINYHS
jgi:hypothetical protein